MLIRFTEKEKIAIKKIATSYGYNVTEYIKRKLFHENIDISSNEDRYISPESGKHNIFTVTAIYKMMEMMSEVLKRQGIEQEELVEIEKKALESARKIRLKYGYQVIKAKNE